MTTRIVINNPYYETDNGGRINCAFQPPTGDSKHPCLHLEAQVTNGKGEELTGHNVEIYRGVAGIQKPPIKISPRWFGKKIETDENGKFEFRHEFRDEPTQYYFVIKVAEGELRLGIMDLASSGRVMTTVMSAVEDTDRTPPRLLPPPSLPPPRLIPKLPTIVKNNGPLKFPKENTESTGDSPMTMFDGQGYPHRINPYDSNLPAIAKPRSLALQMVSAFAQTEQYLVPEAEHDPQKNNNEDDLPHVPTPAEYRMLKADLINLIAEFRRVMELNASLTNDVGKVEALNASFLELKLQYQAAISDNTDIAKLNLETVKSFESDALQHLNAATNILDTRLEEIEFVLKSTQEVEMSVTALVEKTKLELSALVSGSHKEMQVQMDRCSRYCAQPITRAAGAPSLAQRLTTVSTPSLAFITIILGFFAFGFIVLGLVR